MFRAQSPERNETKRNDRRERRDRRLWVVTQVRRRAWPGLATTGAKGRWHGAGPASVSIRPTRTESSEILVRIPDHREEAGWNVRC